MYVPPHDSDNLLRLFEIETDGALFPLQLHPPLCQRHHDRWQAQDEPVPGRLNDLHQSIKRQGCGKFSGETNGKGVEGVCQWVLLSGWWEWDGCVKHPALGGLIGEDDRWWWQLSLLHLRNSFSSASLLLQTHAWIWIWRSIQLLGFLVLQGVHHSRVQFSSVQCDCCVTPPIHRFECSLFFYGSFYRFQFSISVTHFRQVQKFTPSNVSSFLDSDVPIIFHIRVIYTQPIQYLSLCYKSPVYFSGSKEHTPSSFFQRVHKLLSLIQVFTSCS